MTKTAEEALQAMIGHHAALAEGLARRVEKLRPSTQRSEQGEALASLVAFVAEEILPHARAEEETIYKTAAAKEGLGELIRGMLGEHRSLEGLAERLAGAGEAEEALAAAEELNSFFSSHVAKENGQILSALADDPAADLAGLLGQMHARLEAASYKEASHKEDAFGKPGVPDAEAELLRLILEGARRLVALGEVDRACRLVARAWVALRQDRADLAARATAALHGLVRGRDASPRLSVSTELSAEPPGTTEQVLDVRELAPGLRHELIFESFGALGVGGAFILVNDHDPKPLYYQLEAEHSGAFSWEVLEAGPTTWRVRIANTKEDQPADEARGPNGEPLVDLRRLSHHLRHGVIFNTFEQLGEGDAFVLVNDHDPLPLRYQFEVQYPGRYSWDYLVAGPEIWSVRIGRLGARAKGGEV